VKQAPPDLLSREEATMEMDKSESAMSYAVAETVRSWPGEAQSSSRPALELGPICIDPETFTAVQNGQPLPLTRVEYEILTYLMRNAHRVISQQELVARVIGGVYCAESSLVRVHISRLRGKLGKQVPLIDTIRGWGFRFSARGDR